MKSILKVFGHWLNLSLRPTNSHVNDLVYEYCLHYEAQYYPSSDNWDAKLENVNDVEKMLRRISPQQQQQAT